MTHISADRPVLTLINTFTVAPGRQQELLDLLIQATQETMRHRAGFISASFHRSLDGRHVANYAQWRSREDFDSMLNDPEAQVHMKQAAEIAESYEPLLYEVVHVNGKA